MQRNKIIKIGIFIVITGFLSVWGFSYLQNKNFFSSDKIYYAVYDNIKGLSLAGSIYVNGYKVGSVIGMDFKKDNSGQIIVEMAVDNDIIIQRGSIAEIRSLDLMGTMGIAIMRNQTESKVYEQGDTLLSAIEDNLSEQVNKQILPLKIKTEEMISSFDSVLVIVRAIFNDQTRINLQKSFEHIQLTLRNLKSATFSFDNILTEKRSKIQQIIDDTESITANIENNNEAISKILNNFASISDTIAQADIAGTIIKTEEAISSLNKIVQKTENGEGSLGRFIENDSLYNNLNEAAEDLNRLIDDIERRPDRYLHFSAIRFGRPISEKKNITDTIPEN
ncbi:MAG: MlaD family protein [Bacteroidota bacterium]|nr:MlaD family protein [Bacteroidota bacterium]